MGRSERREALRWGCATGPHGGDDGCRNLLPAAVPLQFSFALKSRRKAAAKVCVVTRAPLESRGSRGRRATPIVVAAPDTWGLAQVTTLRAKVHSCSVLAMNNPESTRWVVPDREWRRGVLDPIVLYTISQGATYGYELIRAIRVASGGEFDLNEGTVYPILYRLERAELISSTWGESGPGARRKYYAVTASGEQALETAQVEWQRFVEAVHKTLGAPTRG